MGGPEQWGAAKAAMEPVSVVRFDFEKRAVSLIGRVNSPALRVRRTRGVEICYSWVDVCVGRGELVFELE